jgi:multidrug efflux pump subunit AcrB
MSLPVFAIRNYQITLISVLLMVILGVMSLITMPRTEDPQFSFPFSLVTVAYPGTSSIDMEKLIVDPIEAEMNELDDIYTIGSSIEDGLATISVEFVYGSDPDDKYDDVVSAMGRVREQLPADILRLSIDKVDPDEVAILQVAMRPKTVSWRELEYQADRLQKKLQPIDGVKRVFITGSANLELQVNVDIARIRQLAIPLRQVINQVSNNAQNVPAGHVNAGKRRFTVQTSGDFDNLQQLRETILNPGAEHPIYLQDVADVSIAPGAPTYLTRYNGEEALFVNIIQRRGTNIFDVVENIKSDLARFQKELGSGIALSISHDQTSSVDFRVNGFFNSLIQGLILVGILSVAMLGVRAAAVVVLAIPISTFIGIGWVDFSGYGLQQMSIVGLVIALGLLVDNAIVVTENVSRYSRQGLSPFKAAQKGASEVWLAVASGTLTTILAFLPILLLQSHSGTFLRSMPITVILTLVASLIVAVTLTPLLAGSLLRQKKPAEPKLLKWLQVFADKPYRRWLEKVIVNPIKTLSLAVIIFFGSLSLFPHIGVSMFPKAEKPALLINVDMPEGTSFSATYRAVENVERHLKKYSLIGDVSSNIGRGNPKIYYNITPKRQVPNFAQLYVQLNTQDLELTNDLVRSLRRDFVDFIGMKVSVKEFMQGPPTEAPIEIRIVGDDLSELKHQAIQVEQLVKSVDGTVNVENPISFNKVDIKVDINREKAAIAGVDILDIDNTVRAALVGVQVGNYRDSRAMDFPVVVKNRNDKEANIDDIDWLTVTAMDGTIMPINHVAQLSLETVIPRFSHKDLQRMVRVTADVEDGYITEAVTNTIVELLSQQKLPDGISYIIGGEQEKRKESFGGMSKAFLLAMMGILGVLVAQFRSFKQPLIIFVAIPFALSGAFIGLYIMNYTFSFTAFIGLTSLIGIVVNNSIILVDMANNLRQQGMKVKAAIIESGITRLVPILLTTLTTIAGLLPLTLTGSSMWSPMGWSIIYGLLISTLLTLFIVPVLYTRFTKDSDTKLLSSQPINKNLSGGQSRELASG